MTFEGKEPPRVSKTLLLCFNLSHVLQDGFTHRFCNFFFHSKWFSGGQLPPGTKYNVPRPF